VDDKSKKFDAVCFQRQVKDGFKGIGVCTFPACECCNHIESNGKQSNKKLRKERQDDKMDNT
jgi:hypothetical protein